MRFLSKILFLNYLEHNGTLRRLLEGCPVKKGRFTMEILIFWMRGKGEGEGREIPFLKHFSYLFWPPFLSFRL